MHSDAFLYAKYLRNVACARKNHRTDLTQGKHETAAHHAHLARGHREHAMHHAAEAAKAYIVIYPPAG
jgi:hypothetical protein